MQTMTFKPQALTNEQQAQLLETFSLKPAELDKLKALSA